MDNDLCCSEVIIGRMRNPTPVTVILEPAPLLNKVMSLSNHNYRIGQLIH